MQLWVVPRMGPLLLQEIFLGLPWDSLVDSRFSGDQNQSPNATRAGCAGWRGRSLRLVATRMGRLILQKFLLPLPWRLLVESRFCRRPRSLTGAARAAKIDRVARIMLSRGNVQMAEPQ